MVCSLQYECHKEISSSCTYVGDERKQYYAAALQEPAKGQNLLPDKICKDWG